MFCHYMKTHKLNEITVKNKKQNKKVFNNLIQ